MIFIHVVLLNVFSIHQHVEQHTDQRRTGSSMSKWLLGTAVSCSPLYRASCAWSCTTLLRAE